MSGAWQQLEPEALTGSADSDGQRIELSAAVSLKRIADAAERFADAAARVADCASMGPNGYSLNVWKAGGAE